MRIDWVALCRYAETTTAGTTMVGVGVETTEVRQLPANVGVHAAICIAVSYYEATSEAEGRLELVVFNPEMEPIAQHEWLTPVHMAKPERFPEGWEGKAIQPVHVRFQAESEGDYLIQFSMNGGRSVTSPMRVLRAEEPPP